MKTVTLPFREAHQLVVEFKFIGQVTSIHEYTALESQKKAVTAEVLRDASNLADGRPFTISFGQWTHETLRSYPSMTRFTRTATVYIHEEGAAEEVVT